MKRHLNTLMLLFAFVALPGAVHSQYYDDLYIRPNEPKKQGESTSQTKQVVQSPQTIETAEPVSAYVPDSAWDVDAYNRRYAPEIDESYQAAERAIDTIYVEVEAEENGYYLNGFYGTQSDLEYAERIRKFHNPRFTVHITDPAYTEIYFLNPTDWNVYIDGTYAFVTPTWTNPWYWDYTWSPYSYWGPSWRWSTFYWNWGWGYPYYGYQWGWGYPYYPYHPYPYPGYRPPRPPHHPNYRPQPQTRPSYSPGGWSTRRPNNSGTVSTYPSNTNRVITNSQGEKVRSGNTSRSSQQQTRSIQTEQRNYNQNYSIPNRTSTPSRSSIGSGSSNTSRSSSIGSNRSSGGGSRSRR